MKNYIPFLIVAFIAAIVLSVVFGVYGILFVAGFASGFAFRSFLKFGEPEVPNTKKSSDIGGASGGVSRPAGGTRK